MINNKLIYCSIAFSLLFHFTIIFFFTSKTNNQEIHVVNLSEFREFTFVKPSPPKPKKTLKENTTKKIEENNLQENKILSNKEINTEKKKDVVPLKKRETKEIVEQIEKITEPVKKKKTRKRK